MTCLVMIAPAPSGDSSVLRDENQHHFEREASTSRMKMHLIRGGVLERIPDC